MSIDQRWTPREADTGTKVCQNCRRSVTERFRRVFGDNRDVVYACRECCDHRGLARAAAGLEPRLRTEGDQ